MFTLNVNYVNWITIQSIISCFIRFYSIMVHWSIGSNILVGFQKFCCRRESCEKKYFCLRLLILTRHCCALLKYPPLAVPWFNLYHTSFLLCMVFNSCCTTFSLHKAIKSLVSSNHHGSAILLNHAP